MTIINFLLRNPASEILITRKDDKIVIEGFIAANQKTYKLGTMISVLEFQQSKVSDEILFHTHLEKTLINLDKEVEWLGNDS